MTIAVANVTAAALCHQRQTLSMASVVDQSLSTAIIKLSSTLNLHQQQQKSLLTATIDRIEAVAVTTAALMPSTMKIIES